MPNDIVIDGRGAILYAGTGIGTYTNQLLQQFDQESQITALLPGAEFQQFDFRKYTELKDEETYRREVFLPQFLKEQQAKIFHVPQNGIGLPPQKCCREVVTVHDLIPYFYPETVGKGYLKEFLKSMPEIIQRSDAIITVSQFSRAAILQIFPESKAKIRVIPEAPDPCFCPLPEETVKNCLAKYGIENDYIIYVGGFGPRKNLKALILAYYLLQKETDLKQLLVLPGKRGRENDELEQLAETLGIKAHIIFPGYLNKTELCCFYNGASVMVYPSISEGFGLPPLEAMATGTPVITANSSSLPEVLGDAALYFNPFDSTDLANQLHRVLSSASLRKILIQKGLNKAKTYSWEETARQTMEVYQEILSSE